MPRDARLPINRCNLPAVILGGAVFQKHPAPLLLDGVQELHRDLYRRLQQGIDAATRAQVFRDYMTVRFCLETLEEAGLSPRKGKRAKATYERILRGWSFDSDSRDGAVLKGWVESRFGLTPRFHGEPLRDPQQPGFLRYLEMRARGLYGTNALEAQFDLVYAYCQYELARQFAGQQSITLYRGVNRVQDFEQLGAPDADGRRLVLLNNLNSFSINRERACEFGDYILSTEVPLAKVFYYCGLLPGLLNGEDEFIAIGGVYEVELGRL